MPVRIALPKGRLLAETAALLEKASWKLDGYDSNMRNYRLKSETFPDAQIKVFQEKDIPIQLAIGNYDIGICGLDWVEELSSKFSAYTPIKVKDLNYGKGTLYLAASRKDGISSPEDLCSVGEVFIASEYPNIAESFALNQRLRKFSIFPVWGGADAYPPETATMALMVGTPDAASFTNGLKPISVVLNFSACLIANRNSWEQKDLSDILATLDVLQRETPTVSTHVPSKPAPIYPSFPNKSESNDIVRIALPDGHQQKHMVNVLTRAGIKLDDYPSRTGNRRPQLFLDGFAAKVIRPQDMPLQVANGNFDLAITGSDWVTDHLTAFPASPIKKLADLKFGWVRIVAVVCNDVPVENIFDLREFCRKANSPIRIASEYTNLADKYARDNQLGMYRVIPTWGATEAFLPEDADLLIENTETGSTIARHNLKIIDTLFESTAFLIGTNTEISALKQNRIEYFTDLLTKAVRE